MKKLLIGILALGSISSYAEVCGKVIRISPYSDSNTISYVTNSGELRHYMDAGISSSDYAKEQAKANLEMAKFALANNLELCIPTTDPLNRFLSVRKL